MYPKLAITVNGEPRREIVLEVGQPIPDLRSLSLVFNDPLAPQFSADDRHYRDGGYHFTPIDVLRGQPGTYRVRRVGIRYTDGTSESVPLRDTIVIEALAIPKSEEHRPVFSAR